jgi:hypothetical protein
MDGPALRRGVEPARVVGLVVAEQRIGQPTTRPIVFRVWSGVKIRPGCWHACRAERQDKGIVLRTLLQGTLGPTTRRRISSY